MNNKEVINQEFLQKKKIAAMLLACRKTDWPAYVTNDPACCSWTVRDAMHDRKE
jgi:hypothetical protein